MIKCKCVHKFRDKHGNIYMYKLVDANGKELQLRSEILKQLIKEKELNVTNLTLTSDNRLITSKITDTVNPAQKPVQTQSEQSMPTASNLNYLVSTIENCLIDAEITIIKRKNTGNCLVLQLDVLSNFENTLIIVDASKSYATWVTADKKTLGTIQLNNVRTDIDKIIRTNKLYKKDNSSNETLEAINELINNYYEFLDEWAAEASDWPDSFGITHIVDKVANLLKVDSNDIEQRKYLDIEVYEQVGFNAEQLFCRKSLIDVDIAAIESIRNEIAAQSKENSKTENLFTSCGEEHLESMEEAIDILEETFDLDLQASGEVRDVYPHEAELTITKDGLISCIHYSNFENRLSITAFGTADSKKQFLSVAYVDDWESDTNRLAETIARTLKFDELFGISIESLW